MPKTALDVAGRYGSKLKYKECLLVTADTAMRKEAMAYQALLEASLKAQAIQRMRSL